MSDTVGTIKLGLDIEVGSLISKQIEGVSSKIASNLKQTIEKSTGTVSKSISSTIENSAKGATKAAQKVGTDTGKALSKSMEKAFDIEKWFAEEERKVESQAKEMAKSVSKAAEAKKDANPFGADAAVSKPKLKKYEPASSMTDKVSDGALDLVVRKDNLKEILSGRMKQLDELSIKMGKLELSGKTETSEFAKAQVSYGQLSESIEKMSGDIRKLDDEIDNFDSNKLAKDNAEAAKAASKLEQEARKAASAINKQAIETERLAQAKAKTAIAENKRKASEEKLKQTKKLSNAPPKSSKRAFGGSKSTDSQSKGSEKSTKNTQNVFKPSKILDTETKKVGKSSNMMRSFSRSMARNLLGMNLALSIVSKGVRAMANNLVASFKTNDQFNSSLQQIKSNLATAFQPIFQAVMPAVNALMQGLSKLTAYIAGFVSAIFGKSVKANNASAKAMKKATAGTKAYSDSVKEAQQITAGFDQLNDITESKDSSGAGGDGGGDVGEIIPVNLDEKDMSFIEKSLDKVKGLVSKAFDSAPVQAFTNFATSAMTQFLASGVRIWGALSTNVQQTFSEMWPHMSGGLSNIFDYWTAYYNDLAEMTNKWVPRITDQVVLLIDSIMGTFRPFFVLVSKMWEDWTQIILDLWNKYGKRILDGIGEFITGALDTFNKIWTHIIDPIIQPAIEFLADIWETHLKDILFDLGDFVMNAIARALDLYNKFIKPLIDWVVVNLGPAFVTVFNIIGSTVGGVMKGMLTTVSDIIGSIRRIFDGLMTFLEGVFSGDWKKVWQGMSDVFGGIFDGLKALFKAPINWIIKGLNGFIGGINKVKIPDWVPGVGGKGINIAPLTPLATGGVLKKPTPALMGEYPGARTNPEIVTPENLMRKIVNEAIADNYGSGNNNGGERQPIIINIGGMKMFETIIELGKQYATQTGEQVIFVG